MRVDEGAQIVHMYVYHHTEAFPLIRMESPIQAQSINTLIVVIVVVVMMMMKQQQQQLLLLVLRRTVPIRRYTSTKAQTQTQTYTHANIFPFVVRDGCCRVWSVEKSCNGLYCRSPVLCFCKNHGDDHCHNQGWTNVLHYGNGKYHHVSMIP